MTDSEIHPVRISLFGTGCNIWVGKFNETEWDRMLRAGREINIPLTSGVFSPSFYLHMNNPDISSISDLGNHFKVLGLLDSKHSIIQIQIYRKQRRNIIFGEFIKPTTLFPVFLAYYSSVKGQVLVP